MKKKIDYTGTKRFKVLHPEYGSVTVAAPDEESAIFAAGYKWGVDPTRIAFYAYCTVSKARPAPQNKKRAASAATPTTQASNQPIGTPANEESISLNDVKSKG